HQRRFVEKRSQRIRHLARRVEKAYPKTFQILTAEVGRHVDDAQPLAVASNLPPAGCYGASSETARTSSTDRRTRQTDRQRSFEFLEQHFERNFEWLKPFHFIATFAQRSKIRSVRRGEMVICVRRPGPALGRRARSLLYRLRRVNKQPREVF